MTRTERHAAAVASIEAHWSTPAANRSLIQATASFDAVRGWVFHLLFNDGAPERGVIGGTFGGTDVCGALARVMAAHGVKVAPEAIKPAGLGCSVRWMRVR